MNKQAILQCADWPCSGNRVLRAFFLLLVLWTTGALADGVSFPTRVLYQEQGQYGVNVPVSNSSSTDYLLQSRLVMGAQSDKNAPFIVLPPLQKLAAHQDTVLLIRRTGGQLPTTHESLFWLSVRMIAAESGHRSGMTLKLVPDYRIKVIYRPKALSQGRGVAEALSKLSAKRQGSDLTVINPTPYYVSIAALTQGSNRVADVSQPVPPFGHSDYQFTAPLSGQSVTMKLFDEQGFVLPARQLDKIPLATIPQGDK